MNYQNILQFKGTWRKYQARVLENATKYLQDGRVHIVAAPDSGKTTLGIELIKRLSAPALVLAPSITIREQWVARITDAFLCEGLKPETYLSQDLKDPRVITIVTYQALHSAITRFKGSLEEDDFKEDVDYSDFDVISMIKDNAIGVLMVEGSRRGEAGLLRIKSHCLNCHSTLRFYSCALEALHGYVW